MADLEQLKLLTQETGPEPTAASCSDLAAGISPRMYTDAELILYLDLHAGDVRATAYELLLRKAQNTEAKIGGLSLADQQQYWLRLAASARPNKGGAWERADTA